MPKRAASEELDRDPLMAQSFAHLNLGRHADLQAAQNFALSILANRGLAKYVRHVSLDCSHWPYPARALPYTATTAAERDREASFKAAIAEQKWEESDATELLKRLITTSSPGFNKPSSHQLFPDAVVALLLPLLPNVAKMSVGDISQAIYLEKAIKRAKAKDGADSTVPVTHIELLAQNKYSDGAWADVCFPAFKILKDLPMQRISGAGIGGIGIEDSGAYDDIPSRASAVKEIHLKDCELSGACLSKIIGFSTGLRSFQYRFGGRAGDGSTATVYSPHLAHALTPHTLTMKSLDIDIDRLLGQGLEQEISSWRQESVEEAEDTLEDEDGKEDKSGSESLDSASSKGRKTKLATTLDEATASNPYFPHLTHLRIGIELASRFTKLSGKQSLAEWLPASLEELELVGYGPQTPPDLIRQVTEVVEQRETRLANLKTLTGVDEYIENGQELADEEDYEAAE